MFNSRDFLRVEYIVLSKNVTRGVSQSEKTLSEVIKQVFLLLLLCVIVSVAVPSLG